MEVDTLKLIITKYTMIQHRHVARVALKESVVFLLNHLSLIKNIILVTAFMTIVHFIQFDNSAMFNTVFMVLDTIMHMLSWL